MIVKYVTFCMCVLVYSVMLGCSRPSQQTVELKRFPIDSLDGIITRSGAELDKDVSSDGKGSLRITARGPATIRLFKVDDIDVENARLTYQAKVRTRNVEGQVYLEMQCHFPEKGEIFSRNSKSAVTGTANWMTMETSCSLEKGERPDLIKLNLVIDGKGTVWIDDIRLIKGPLQ